MSWEAWFTVGVIVLMVFAMLRNLAGPDVIMLGGLMLVMTMSTFSGSEDVPTPVELVSGFGNSALITIGMLFVVATGLSQTGAMDLLTQPLLGRPRTVAGAQSRIMVLVSAMSAFLNNTPLVAMFIPVVREWSKRTGISPSKLYLPLSYAAILGGTCTLIGTSTNLVVYGLVKEAKIPGVELNMFTLTVVGLPVTVLGIAYVLLFSRKLLPDRRGASMVDYGDARQYTLEMLVAPGGAVDDRTIEQAGLRHLPGVFLVEIDREDERLVAPGPEKVLRGNDRLIFAGVVDSIVDLQRIRGLVPSTNQVFKLTDPRPDRCLVEAVVSETCPLVGKTIREGRFRSLYNAVVIAVHRGGEHLNQRIGDIRLQPGDTLLIETNPRFVDQQRNSRDFYLVSAVADSKPLRHDRAYLALAILAAMVLLVTFEVMDILTASFWAAGLMVVTRCCLPHEARRGVDWRVLIVIGAALGIGNAMETTGAARHIALELIAALHVLGPLGVLAGVVVITMIFTELISHAGAAVLIFPIAQEAAHEMNVNFMPFVVAITVAASCSFSTPIGYQTNLMVYGPGGYRYSDYLRFGIPLSLLVMGMIVLIAPWWWGF